MSDEWLTEQAILAQAHQPSREYIDTLRSHPRIRHKIERELERGWMLTKCGRKVINYFYGDCTLHYADGSVYARLCPICFRRK